MSRFLVCWNRGGASVPPRFATVADALPARDGASPPRRLACGDVWAWQWPSRWVSGAEDRLPLREDGWMGAGALRLDDRATLQARLRDAGELRAHDDASLAWASFRAWDVSAATRWIGDFSVAAVAPARDRLVVSRSSFGIRACFVADIGEVTAVSDDLGLLVALRGGAGAAPDIAIAEYLRHGQLVSPELTFHHDVRRVPSGRTLVIARDGSRSMMVHRTLPTPAIRHDRSDAAVRDEFWSVLDAAVRDRLRVPSATLMLSGGLDSAALAFAARRVAPAGAVAAMTVDWSDLLPDDEARYARLTAEAAGVPHEVIRPPADEGLGAVGAIETPEPMPDAEALLSLEQARRAAARAPLVLSGEDPDALLAPPTLAGVIANEGWSSSVRGWRAYRRATGDRPWIGVRQFVWRSSARLSSGTERPPAWLRAPYVRLAHREETGPTHPTRERAARPLRDPLWDACAWLDDPALTGLDVVTVLPYMDPRMIEFSFSLPAFPWLQRKHLLRDALRGLAPDDVVTRPKSPLRGYFEARVARWRTLGAPAVLAAPVDEWVDVARWRRDLADSRDADTVLAAWRVLELSRWLAQPRRA